MKDKSKWHKFPDELPPENECIRLEVWNEIKNYWECVAAMFFNGSLCFYDRPIDSPQKLFFKVPDEIYWRLWED